jgi:hypothetical protein
MSSSRWRRSVRANFSLKTVVLRLRIVRLWVRLIRHKHNPAAAQALATEIASIYRQLGAIEREQQPTLGSSQNV